MKTTKKVSGNKPVAVAKKSTDKTNKSGEQSHPPKFESDGITESPVAFEHHTKPVTKSGLGKFFVDSLKDMLWAENFLLKALAKMEEEATSTELRQAFHDHRDETEDHISRLEEIFEMLDEKPQAKKCEAIDGIGREVDRTVSETHDKRTCDTALIFGGQKAEHYEIASYTSLIALARSLGKNEAAELLEDTLEEEKEADRTLAGIADRVVYEHTMAE